MQELFDVLVRCCICHLIPVEVLIWAQHSKKLLAGKRWAACFLLPRERVVGGEGLRFVFEPGMVALEAVCKHFGDEVHPESEWIFMHQALSMKLR